MKRSTTRTAAQRPTPIRNGRATICVVDQQPGGNTDWHAVAHDSGADVHVLASAEEALRVSSFMAVDLWVVNACQPAISGFELCQMLKSQLPAAAVWIVADEYSDDVERQALASRATMFVCQETLNQALEPALRNFAARSSVGPVKSAR